MRLAFRVVLLGALLAPLDAGAAKDDLAYCSELYDMAVRYRGNSIQGDNKPSRDMIIALDQCRNGQASQGIATLEQILTNGKISLPPR